MALSREQIYNDLDGEEVKVILQERFAALLNASPYLRRNVTLPRVRMELTVRLSMSGSQVGQLTLEDDMLVRTATSPEVGDDAEVEELSTEVDSSSIPPDKIREDHGIPIAHPQRVPNLPYKLHEDTLTPYNTPLSLMSPAPASPAPPSVPPPAGPLPGEGVREGGTPYARWVVQDRGGSVARTGIDIPNVPGAGIIQDKNPRGGLSPAPVQSGFKDAIHEANEQRKIRK